MKIVYINQYFKTPAEAGSTRSYWITRELISRGYEVVMVCQSNSLLKDIRQRKLIEESIVEGIRVISVRNTYHNGMGTFQRIWAFLKFMFACTYIVYKQKNIKLVIASSTPLTVAFPALIRYYLKKTPFVFEVRDLWPEAPIQLRFIKNGLVIRFLRWFERLTYKKAIHVNTLSPGMQQGVTRHIPLEKTSMIPNMAKIDKFWPRPKDLSKNEKFNISNETFKLIYFGTMGVANGIDYIIKAIHLLETQKCAGVEFIFMGDGAMKQALLNLSEKLFHIKVTVLERQPMEVVSEIVNNCDVSICTFSNIPILKTNSPNKLFDTLSAGKASIVNSDGWTKDIVEDYNCGFYADPENPHDFKDKILQLKNDKVLLETMGNNARKIAIEKFDKSILCKQFADIIDAKMLRLSK